MNVESVDAAGWNDSQSAAQTTAEVGANVKIGNPFVLWFEDMV